MKQVLFKKPSHLTDRLLVTTVFALAFLAMLSILLPGASFQVRLQIAAYLFGIAEVLMEAGYALFGPATAASE